MPKVENLNQSLLLTDLVVNENRAVDQLTHLRPLANGVSHVRKPPKQVDVIQQRFRRNGWRPRGRPERYAPRSRTGRLTLFA